MTERDLKSDIPVLVALDLETTGLSPEQDGIIEIGAVKFRGQEVLDTFETFVNPYREIPPEVRRLTGIAQRQVDRAVPFPAVAGDLSEFVGTHPIVGHRISFDLGFLFSHGLQFSSPAYDTWELASMLLPYTTDYSLMGLAQELGAEHGAPHRALSDATATHQVFVQLTEMVRSLDPAVLAYIQHLGSLARWQLGRLFEQLAKQAGADASRLGITGLNLDDLGGRLKRAERGVRPAKVRVPVDEDKLAGYMDSGGLFSLVYPGFEHRPQQVEMLRAVSGALNAAEHLIVEGGTGVGKSLAYLLPSIMYSISNGVRVVISTNTINLQEQLLRKDIPTLVKVLEESGIIPAGRFRATALKGRANYLCLRRWTRLARGEGLSQDEARLLSKALVWLQDTAEGDRGEINISGRDLAIWTRISAGEKGQCPGVRGEGVCFLRAARERAEAADVTVVNHALLLSDLALGGGLLPEHQHLIVDEAHHLEEAATRQLGFQISQGRLPEELDGLGRILGDVRVIVRGSGGAGLSMHQTEQTAVELETGWSRTIRGVWDRLWNVVERFLERHSQEEGGQDQLLITRSTRAQPAWSDVEIAWENLDVGLVEGIKAVEKFLYRLDSLPSTGPPLEELKLELSAWLEGLEELREQLKSILAAPAEEGRIDWVSRTYDSSGRLSITLYSAPLNVGPQLEERLFSRKASVILTSATLAAQGNFEYFRERVGLAESEARVLGSPFDFRRAALLLVPEDMPMPNSWEYQSAMENVLTELTGALGGYTLVLFTSHAALRGAARSIRGTLERDGIHVLAQGIDGSPRQIVRRFNNDPKAVILGTSSFWEGVDLSGGVLKALVLARLPFHVPTEPVFAARSAQYEDPFYRYAVPQAVLRFRQGIGRLIRGSQDRGVVVVMDKRVIARRYGKAFLDSAVDWTVKMEPLATIPERASEWIGKSTTKTEQTRPSP